MVMTAERGGAQVSRIGQDVLHLWRRVQSTERAMKQAVLEIARLDRPNLPEILPPRADATIPAPPRLPRPADEQGNETTFVSRAEMAVTRSESEPPPASRTLPSPSPKGRRGR
jgi:hypothetical protein